MSVWAQPPLVPGEDEARKWAEEELSRAIYQGDRESLFQKLLNALFDLFTRADSQTTLPVNAVAVLIVVFLLVLVGVALFIYGPLRRTQKIKRDSHEVLVDDPRSALEMRAAAQAHEEAGQWSQAVLERFRALTRSLIERVILEDQPGQTAHEVARATRIPFPDAAVDIERAAELFDRVCYGEIPATGAEARWMRELDERVENTRPAVKVTAV